MYHPFADLPIVVLYNLNRAWPFAEVDEIQSMAQDLQNHLTLLGHQTTLVCLQDQELERALAGFDPGQWIVFNWCEEIPGIPRSSAIVARKLEELGFAFTGADSLALQFSYDKPAVKRRLKQHGVDTPAWQLILSKEDLVWDCFPAIVKPAYEHCSLGITHEAVVHNREELSRQVAKVSDMFNEPVMVEDFIDGREFHVSVVGNGKLDVFPIAEMDFSSIREDTGRLCTYDSKFVPDSTDYQMIQLRLPAALSGREKRELGSVAIAAYRATNCRDYARLDIRQRDGIFYVLDVNPNADISPDTSLALSADLAGYSYGQLASLLVNLAAHRHPLLGRQSSFPVCHSPAEAFPVI